MNSEFLIPFLAMLVSTSWALYAKAVCASNFDYVEFLDSGLYNLIISALLLCAVAGLIISWVGGGFVIFLGYLGTAIATIFLARYTTNRILVAIFGYQSIGAILPILCAIASAVWMFSSADTF